MFACNSEVIWFVTCFRFAINESEKIYKIGTWKLHGIMFRDSEKLITEWEEN